MKTQTMIKTNPTRNDLPHNVRAEMIQLLNARLADCSDLYTQVKQAHWNVKGPSFIGLHELFDQIAARVLVHQDEIAERLTALGGIAAGTARMVAKASTLDEFPEPKSQDEFVGAVAERLAQFGKQVRDAADTADEAGDLDTSDLFIAVSRSIDKDLWFVESHLQ